MTIKKKGPRAGLMVTRYAAPVTAFGVTGRIRGTKSPSRGSVGGFVRQRTCVLDCSSCSSPRMTRLGVSLFVALGAVLGCSRAAHVRNGVGCVDDSRTVVLAVPADHDAAAASWLIRLDAPLLPGDAIRISRAAQSSEYREGGETPSFVSTDVDGILKRVADQQGSERYALKAIATHPSIDVQGVGRRAVEGLFSVERRSQCR